MCSNSKNTKLRSPAYLSADFGLATRLISPAPAGNLWNMSAEAVIEQIRQLSPSDIEKVGEFLAEWADDRLAAARDLELEEGRVAPLSEETVLRRLQPRLG
jgi:hypothetical protein